MGEGPRVILVGHCTPDAYFLSSVIRRAIEGAEVVKCNTAAALEREIPGAALLLVNRALDGSFSQENGVELIKALAAAPGRIPAMMLVSNFPEAQAQAQAAGALPGFGKAKIGSPETAEKLRAAVPTN